MFIGLPRLRPGALKFKLFCRVIGSRRKALAPYPSLLDRQARKRSRAAHNIFQEFKNDFITNDWGPLEYTTNRHPDFLKWWSRKADQLSILPKIEREEFAVTTSTVAVE